MGIQELVKEHKLKEAEEKGLEKGMTLSIRRLLLNGFPATEVGKLLKVKIEMVQKIEQELRNDKNGNGPAG